MMNEKEEVEGTTEDTGERVQPEAVGLIDSANAAAERTEKAVKELREENDRKEEMLAKDRLGGISEAGKEPEPVKEESPKDYKDKIMRGEQ